MAIAGVKISSLRELTNAQPDDYLIINDASQETTKKITFANLFSGYAGNVRDSATGAFVNNLTTNQLDVNVNLDVGQNATIGGDLTVGGTITFDTLKDAVENITITKLVDAADGVASNDNDTTIPTTAAIKAYVDGVVSDHRAKDILSYTTDALSLVTQLKVYQTRYKPEVSFTDDQVFDSLIAHELQEVIPYAVNGTKDAVYEDGKPEWQTVNYQKLVPVLIRAIQELAWEVDTLKNGSCNDCNCNGRG